MRQNRCSFKQFSLGVPGIPLQKWEVVGIFHDIKEWISYLKNNCYHTQPETFSPSKSHFSLITYLLPHFKMSISTEGKSLLTGDWVCSYLLLFNILFCFLFSFIFFVCFVFESHCFFLPPVSSVRSALTTIWIQLVLQLSSVALIFREQLLRAF